MKEQTYHEQMNINNSKNLQKILSILPNFCADFFNGIETSSSLGTRVAYAHDLRNFFEFLHDNNTMFTSTPIQEYDISILNVIKPVDIEKYLDYLNYYKKGETEYTNGEQGKMRKLATLRSLYNYFYKNELVEKNVPFFISTPKLHQKSIVNLDSSEIAMLLNEVEKGKNLTSKQQDYHTKTRIRDLAMFMLILGTGIRVSECVGLNINDVNFKINGIRIYRKGGNNVFVYFSKEVEEVLRRYIQERKSLNALAGDENALFLSMQMKRITIRAVEKLVKKYTNLITHSKNITPHKLRSTYGTNLYRETGDIYLVADVLGHRDVQTTKKLYSSLEEERRIKAANFVKLR